MARTKTKARPIPVPQSTGEADLFIRQIGEMQRERDRIETEMNAVIANTKALHAERVKEIDAEMSERAKGLETWAAANRKELTNDGRTKTAKLHAGEISWRHRPPRVTLRKVEDVIASIKALGLADRFIRIKEEANKEAMLADPETAAAIDGVTIGSDGEDFVVKPFETELEQVA